MFKLGKIRFTSCEWPFVLRHDLAVSTVSTLDTEFSGLRGSSVAAAGLAVIHLCTLS